MSNCLAVLICTVFGIPSVVDGSLLIALASVLGKQGGLRNTVISDFLPY